MTVQGEARLKSWHLNGRADVAHRTGTTARYSSSALSTSIALTMSGSSVYVCVLASTALQPADTSGN
jgi:hypothetical protein